MRAVGTRRAANPKRRPAMKRWAAMMMSMILVLLSIGIAQSQTAMSGQSSSGGIRVAPRRPAAARQSMTGQALGSSLHPGFARRPGFVNQPGFVHSGFVRNPAFARPSGFARSGRFPFWPGFATNRIFFVRGGVLAPWPYWYNYPPPSSTPSTGRIVRIQEGTIRTCRTAQGDGYPWCPRRPRRSTSSNLRGRRRPTTFASSSRVPERNRTVST